MKAKANAKFSLELGEYIVADSQICHRKATFRGTRIMVFQVLEQVAYGTPWQRIVWSWRGKITMAAITEAGKLASELFNDRGCKSCCPGPLKSKAVCQSSDHKPPADLESSRPILHDHPL
jgi:uncharacterized protein (DUF433 family)